MSPSDSDGSAETSGTPEWQLRRIREYYAATDQGYLQGWAKNESHGFHFGLADQGTTSLDESLNNTNRFLAERSGVDAGSRVLDAGCGVGGSALWLAEHLGAQVVGVTIVQSQVDLARSLARERQLDRLLTFECMDMTATSLPERSFDAVWNVESMVHVVDLEAYLRHVHWLLREGGLFVCHHYCRTEKADDVLVRQVEEGWALSPIVAKENVLHAMARAGFVESEHIDLTSQAMMSAMAMRAMASRTLLILRAESAFAGAQNPVYEAHVRAALAMVEGLESGQLTLSHFRGMRPRSP